MPELKRRRAVPRMVQVRVFRRDCWLCRWCGRAVVFAPVMRYMEAFARAHGQAEPLAYFRDAWTRRDAPLLDHLAAVIDHVKPHALGGGNDEENLVTSCNKCNVRKNSVPAEK